jgi:hypothetical protein
MSICERQGNGSQEFCAVGNTYITGLDETHNLQEHASRQARILNGADEVALASTMAANLINELETTTSPILTLINFPFKFCHIN